MISWRAPVLEADDHYKSSLVVDRRIWATGLVYGTLYLSLGFNYIETFLYASSIENPNGFMLFAEPTGYFVARLQDILDILLFLGPVLLVMTYLGFISLRRDSELSGSAHELYYMILAAVIALVLLFLTGAPKKGETARICMFILPFVVTTVAYHMHQGNYSQGEVLKLILLVLAQAVFMQVIGVYVW